MGFSMNVSDAEEIKKEVVEEVKPSSEEVNKLKKLSNSNVEAIMNINMDSLYERKEILKSIDEFGLDTIQRSSQKNELLEVSIKNLSKMGDEGGEVAVGLTELQRTMKDLDPSMIDFTKKGLFGRVSNPIRAYFDKYQKADTVINDIMESLERGKTTLKNDNTTLEIEEIGILVVVTSCLICLILSFFTLSLECLIDTPLRTIAFSFSSSVDNVKNLS